MPLDNPRPTEILSAEQKSALEHIQYFLDVKMMFAYKEDIRTMEAVSGSDHGPSGSDFWMLAEELGKFTGEKYDQCFDGPPLAGYPTEIGKDDLRIATQEVLKKYAPDYKSEWN